MIDVTTTLLSQYANSPTLVVLINDFNEAVDPSIDFDNFYDDIWNLKTAVGYGLDIWGRIVGVPRIMKIPSGDVFGFDGSGCQPFNQAPFYSDAVTDNWPLVDDVYRPLIFLKAQANLSGCSIPEINAMLTDLFGPGGVFYDPTVSVTSKCYVANAGRMSMDYTFEFTLSPIQYAVLTQSGCMLQPAGVDVNIVQL